MCLSRPAPHTLRTCAGCASAARVPLCRSRAPTTAHMPLICRSLAARMPPNYAWAPLLTEFGRIGPITEESHSCRHRQRMSVSSVRGLGCTRSKFATMLARCCGKCWGHGRVVANVVRGPSGARRSTTLCPSYDSVDRSLCVRLLLRRKSTSPSSAQSEHCRPAAGSRSTPTRLCTDQRSQTAPRPPTPARLVLARLLLAST